MPCRAVSPRPARVYPPAEQDGRGKGHEHIPFQWNADKVPKELSADRVVPGKGQFGLVLRADAGYIDVMLSIRNDMGEPLGPIDWAFCPISL